MNEREAGAGWPARVPQDAGGEWSAAASAGARPGPATAERDLRDEWQAAMTRLRELPAGDPAREAAEAATRRLGEQYEAVRPWLEEETAGAVVAISADGRYLDPSPEFLALLHADRDTVHGADVGLFGSPDHHAAAQAAFAAFVASGAAVAVSEAVLELPDGTRAPFRATVVRDAEDPRRYIASYEAIPSLPPDGPSMRTIATVLSEWRAVEREAASLGDHPRRFELGFRARLLRAEYQRLERELARVRR